MDTFHFSHAAENEHLARTLVGCVASGDLEVMIEPAQQGRAEIFIQSSASTEQRWQQILDVIAQQQALPSMRMDIHDFAATPGVIRLRIEQALEIAREGNDHVA